MSVTPAPIPPKLASTYRGWEWAPFYRNQLGVVTHRLRRSGETLFAKVAPATTHPSLSQEAERMRWAGNHLPVPTILDCDAEAGHQWLVTRALPGEDATRHSLLQTDPARLVGALARGLSVFHALPVAECPWRFDLETSVPLATERVQQGLVEPSDLNEDFAHLTPEQALAQLLRTRPDSEDLVVCHGDYCFPNLLLTGEEVTGYVDLGELGVACRWWDLAVATWSTIWNAGPGHEDAFTDAYGVARDEAHIQFYRLLYCLVS
ncbi:MAG: APH(3') family aminoglycoside O-phosphotransferase [Myxococcota bacterium]